MRPLQVVQVLEATAGGTRRHVRDLTHALDRDRFNVTLIVSPGRDPDFMRDVARYRREGLSVELLSMQRRIAPLADAVALARLIRLLRRLRPDIVHAHSSKAGMLVRLAARCAGDVPTVYTPHAFAFLSDSPLRGLYLACERRVAHRTGRLIALSREEREWACDGVRGLGLPPERVRLIPNGVADGGLPPPRETRQSPTVGFVGRMCRQKGPDLFLDVAQRIRVRRPDARFLMIGEGSWRKRVGEWSAARGLDGCVTLDVARDETEVAAHLAKMDVLVMPSRWEGLPYTLLEAMGAGVPVAAMAAGGIADVLEEGDSGLLCPVGDVDGLARHSLALIADPALADRIRTGARRRLGAYTLEGMTQDVTAVYQELTEERMPAPGAHLSSA